MADVKLECEVCGKSFFKVRGEYNRRIKLGKTRFYCSLKCTGRRKENLRMLEERLKDFEKRDWEGNRNRTYKKTDKQILESSMKDYYRRMKKRTKEGLREDIVDLNELVKVWKAQNGRCAHTGVELINTRSERYKTCSNNYKASVDRIDCSRGYIPGNIQFVSCTVNYAKSTMSEDELREFFQIIIDKHNED